MESDSESSLFFFPDGTQTTNSEIEHVANSSDISRFVADIEYLDEIDLDARVCLESFLLSSDYDHEMMAVVGGSDNTMATNELPVDLMDIELDFSPNELAINPLQYGFGNDDDDDGTQALRFNKIEIITDRQRNLRFRQSYMKTSSRLHFKDVVTMSDLEEAMEEIATYIRRGKFSTTSATTTTTTTVTKVIIFNNLFLVFNAADFVGVRIRLTNNVTDNGVYISPRRVDQIRGDVILEQYADVIQSNKDFEAFGEIYIDVDQIYLPRGGAVVRLTRPSNTPLLDKLRKKSLIFTSNFMAAGEQCCFYLAVVLCVSVLNNTYPLKKRISVRKRERFRNGVRNEARRLCQLIGLNFENIQSLPSITEFDKVQTVLETYSIEGHETQRNVAYKLIL